MSDSSSRPNPYGGQPPRRLSYASVASGAAPQNVPTPTRSGAFSHLANTSSGSSHTTQYHQDSRFQRRQSGNDEANAGSISWRKSASLPSYSRRFAHIPGVGSNPAMPNPFFIPSYLQHTRYAARLESEHKARVRREREHPSIHTSNPPSLSSSATGPNVHRLAPSHRGMTYDVIESNPPKDEDQLMPLPTRWSEQDKYPGLDITNGGLDLRYNGSASKADIEAASVRADYPMSPACGIYYFEVTMNSKSKDSAIAVGFSTAEASLERLPGWETHSWGYHGDDGKMFSGEHSGRAYGPTFTANDVVGCGINFNTGQAFFTLNGRDLDIAFRDLKDVKPFPSVGMKKYPGTSVSVNFGQRPFVFDIQDKMHQEQISVNKEIAKAKTSNLRPGMDESSLIQELVAQYLAHDGYVETAKAFAAEVKQERISLNSAQPGSMVDVTSEDDTDAIYRQRIRQAILDGNIDQALDVTHDHFPTVPMENPQIVFRLKCRKWVELISKAAELRNRDNPSHKQRRASNGFGKSSAVIEDFAQDMEIDEQSNGTDEAINGSKDLEDIDLDRHLRYDELMAEAMEYGQLLQRQYRDEQDGEFQKTLEDIFSLVLYENPRDGVHGHLLNVSGRMAVAEELNSAILVSLGRPPSAALEKTYKQTEVLVDMLAQDGGPAAFVSIQREMKVE